MFFFADKDYKLLVANKDIMGFEDNCLVLCEQMIEKVLKGILKEETGEYPNKNNLKLLLRSCSFFDKYKNYIPLCSDLTDCYFERRYESDEYYEYSKEGYLSMVNESIEFYNLLLSERNTSNLHDNNIKDLSVFN